MKKLESTTLEGCINSYINNMTDAIDVYNEENNLTDIKTCITKKDNLYIINIRYNPNVVLGIIDIEGGVITNVSLSKDHYTSPTLEYQLNKLFKGYTLINSNGDVI